MKLKFNSKMFATSIRQKRLIDMNIEMRILAKKIHVSPATISRCENEKRPDIETFAKLCAWLEIPMNDFFEKTK